MTAYTTKYSLPYPEGQDEVAVHTDVEALAARAALALDEVNPIRGLVPQNTNVDAWYDTAHEGQWYINSTTTAQTVTGLPTDAAGILHCFASTGYQTYMSYGADPGWWFRGIVNVTSKEWSAWQRINNGAGQPAAGVALEHRVRADSSRKRLGYRIGIGSRTAVMLRFDDYPQNFQTKVLPVLRDHDLPSYYACTVRWTEELQPTPWATVEDWAISHGVQIWNHSSSHSAASTPSELEHEIVESADYMESQMPAVKIDGWVMPGTGVSTDPYGGYNGNTDADFYDTLAGQKILGRHGIVNAARAGYHQPVGGHPIGQTHNTYEAWTVQQFKDYVTGAAGYGVALMLHPGNLDKSGYMTTAQFTECMQWLAAERAAGRVMTLTGAAAAVLDAGDHRDNLLPGTFTDGLTGWAGTGWGEAGGVVTSPSTTAALTYVVDTGLCAWARGSTRELHVVVKADTAATVRIRLTGNGLETSKDYTIPAGAWVDVRKYFTIPYTGLGTFEVRVSRISGGPVHLQQVNAWAA